MGRKAILGNYWTPKFRSGHRQETSSEYQQGEGVQILFLNISHNILFIVIFYSYKSEHILSNNIHSYKNMKNKILVLL